MTTQLTRRQMIKLTAGTMAGAILTSRMVFDPGTALAYAQSGNLPKFVYPLRRIGIDIPIATPDSSPAPVTNVQHYTIDIGEFTDTLYDPAGTALPPTTLWGYNPAPAGVTPSPSRHMGGIFAVRKDVPVQITFRNNLPAQHILPVDHTVMGTTPLTADNRAAVHIHGGHVSWISDGGPFDWWDPAGNRGPSFMNNTVLNPAAAANEAEYYYPNDQSARLMWYHDHAWGTTRLNAYAGVASAYVITDSYEDQLVDSAGAVKLPGPFDMPGVGPTGRTIYMVFQDKIFVNGTTATQDPTWATVAPKGVKAGSLWYPHVYDPLIWALAPGGLPLPDPSVIAEMFGDTMLVNGTVAPTLTVEPRQYRFRMLNACNARFLNPRLVYAQGTVPPASTEPNLKMPVVPFTQIGTEGGFLPAPVPVNGPKQPQLLLAPAERCDVIADFTGLPAGTVLLLYNDAPAPFPGGAPSFDFYPGNPATPTAVAGSTPNTRTIMQIVVGPLNPAVPLEPLITLPATFTPTEPFMITQTPGVPYPYTVTNPLLTPTGTTGTATINVLVGGVVTPVTATLRYITLNEAFDLYGRLAQMIGTNQPPAAAAKKKLTAFGLEYLSPATEVVTNGSYEIWEILNLTADTHPMHFHLVNGHVLSRQSIKAKGFAGGVPMYSGQPKAPDANELGWKETVRTNPGEATRVLFKFDLPANPPNVGSIPISTRVNGHEYVYHCHILEHEEHDMMRPLVVV